MIQVIGIMLRTKMMVEASAIAFMCRVVPGQKSKTMIFTPLIAWYSTAATRPSSSSLTTQLWYTLDDAVVGLGTPADDGGVHHVREQEQDHGDAGDAMQQPGPLPRTALVQGPDVGLPLRHPALEHLA